MIRPKISVPSALAAVLAPALAALLACGGGGEGEKPAGLFNRPPGAPKNVRGEAQVGVLALTWLEPDDRGDDEVRGYVVTLSPGGRTLHSGRARSVTVEGLAPGGTYSATVKALNFFGEGPLSAPSTPVMLPNVPGAPGNVNVLPNPTSIFVTWEPPESEGDRPLVDYLVLATPGELAVSTRETFATIEGVVPGATYAVSVVARNAAGSGVAGDPVTVTIPSSVPIRPSCREHFMAGVLSSGVYSIQPGSVPMVAYCDMGFAAQGRTLLGHYTGQLRNRAFDPARAQVQDTTGGHPGTASWSPQPAGNYGHLPYSQFAPLGRDVLLECGTSRSNLSGTATSPTLFADFSSGLKGAYGTPGMPGAPGWGLLAKAGSGHGRSGVGACGELTDTDAGGIAYCSGMSTGTFSNHLVSFSDSPKGTTGPLIGCGGTGCNGMQPCSLEVWVWLK